MRLEIKNNILFRCELAEGENRIELPYDVKYIEKDAFADIPAGQVKHMTLSRNLEGFAPNSFHGIEKLESLTVYAYPYENRENYLLHSADLLKLDTLCILQNNPGDFFALSAMVKDGYPRHLIMQGDTDVRYCGRENYEGDYCGFDGVEELTLYVKDAIRLDPYLFTNTQMHFQLKKLRFVNYRYQYPSEENVIYERYPSLDKKGHLRAIRPVPLNWQELHQWTPCFFRKTDEEEEYVFPGRGLSELKGLEEVILPEGLTDIDDEMFSNCPLLRKIVLPSTVAWVGKNAFRGNRSLQTVKLGEKVLDHIQVGAFEECLNLKKISIIYDEYSPNRTVQKVSKKELQKRITLNYAAVLVEEIWPQAIDEAWLELEEELFYIKENICILKVELLFVALDKIRVNRENVTAKEQAVLDLIRNILYRCI